MTRFHIGCEWSTPPRANVSRKNGHCFMIGANGSGSLLSPSARLPLPARAWIAGSGPAANAVRSSPVTGAVIADGVW